MFVADYSAGSKLRHGKYYKHQQQIITILVKKYFKYLYKTKLYIEIDTL